MKDLPFPLRVYRQVPDDSGHGFLVKFAVFLKDRPGSLADFSSLIARSGGNISIFHYDRSTDSSRVVVEVEAARVEDVHDLAVSLAGRKYAFERKGPLSDEVSVTSPENILEIKVRLRNEPGTLAALARLLKGHKANVMYMLYDGDIDPEVSDIALATKGPEEIDGILDTLNGKGYHYRVVYRGSEGEKVENIIGLKAVEKFYMRLLKLLDKKDVSEMRKLVDSSREIYGNLVKFYSEAGNNLESADVFEKVLTLASMSRSRLGQRFRATEMSPLEPAPGVRLHGFRMPTSENIYVFENDGDLTMVDSGYGIYYRDIKRLMARKGLDASRVRRIFVTHADADHAGTSGYFTEEFGSEVFMHPDSRGVISSGNRAHGTGGRLARLNKYYTRLINTFTECRFPGKINYFKTKPTGSLGGFDIIDSFAVGGLKFSVLSSRGGHIPGHVFFVEPSLGLVFASDYMINIASLSEEEKGSLGVYKYLLTNPNSNHEIFKEEVAALKEIISSLDAGLRRQGLNALVFPGHGDYYAFAGR
ncbi:MAG: MBL fold metallo-hydrolase [Nitrospirota bacterium]